MSDIHKWQSAQRLARLLGVSLYYVQQNTPERIEARDFTAEEEAAARAAGEVVGRVKYQRAYRVREGFTSADIQAKKRKPPRAPAPPSTSPPSPPPPLPPIPPRKREPIALRLKGSAPDSPPLGYLFGEPPPDAVKPITLIASMISYRTGDPQSLVEQIAGLIAKEFPSVGVVTLAVGLDMEMYGARCGATKEEP